MPHAQVDSDTCQAVWRTLLSWIGAQMALKQGAGVTNLGRFTWSRDSALASPSAPLKPVFVLGEGFARTYHLK